MPSGRHTLLTSIALLSLLLSMPPVRAGEEPLVDDRPTLEILAEVLAGRDSADRRLFALLARRRDESSQAALERISGVLQSAESIDAVFAAFTLYAGRQQAEARAIEFLDGKSRANLPYARRAATRALVAFGGRARAELEMIVGSHGDHECRRLAIGGIVRLLHTRRRPMDLELLIRWYRPPTSGSHELGVRTLSVFQDEDSLDRFEDALRERGLPNQTRSMILEALAKMGGARSVEIALDGLSSRFPAVQLASIKALESLGWSEHARVLSRLERARDAAVRHAALRAQAPLRAGDEEWTEKVLRAARSRDFALRMAAASLLVGIGLEQALDALHMLLEDGNPLVRRETIRAMVHLRRKSTIERLVGRIEHETMRNREEILEILRVITGLDYGVNPTRWLRWWEAEGEGFKIPSHDEAIAAVERREAMQDGMRTEAVFYGIPLKSDRIAFVLDVSGSMSGLAYSGEMRIDSVRRELLAVLESMPDGAWFNLIFFDDRISRWKRRLVAMNDSTRAAAIKFARKQGPGGGTALFDGLEEAYDDPEVDTIVLLSDGEPTEGRIVDTREILEVISQWNVLREVVIHTVSVNWASDLLRDLARETGGSYIEVR